VFQRNFVVRPEFLQLVTVCDSRGVELTDYGEEPMDKNRLAGGAKQVSGAATEAAGKLSGNRKLKAKGKARKTTGKIQSALGRAADKVRSTLGLRKT